MRLPFLLTALLILHQALGRDTIIENTDEDEDYIDALKFEGEELEETPEDLEEAEVVEDWWRSDQDSIPDFLNNHDRGVVHRAMQQGGSCNSCGQISGVHALEARIALVSENYVPYSIQNFMNCNGKICGGAQPYKIATMVKKSGWVVPKHELPYTKHACKGWGEGTSKCHCGHEARNFTNVLDDQFVFIGPTVRAETEEKLKHALQSGPATTCFTRKRAKQLGALCRNGCAHANSIVGYTKNTFILQESYGRAWGKHDNGSWETPTDDACGKAIRKKAYFTVIFYDYDRANAYFEENEVAEPQLKYLDFEPGLHFTETDLKNIGTAKNRCAFLGWYCKGVVVSSSGEFKLVSSVSTKKKKMKDGFNLVTYFRKKQMVIYVQNGGASKYIRVRKRKKGDPKLQMATSKKHAAPFFTSYGRIISYRHPQYHLVNNQLVKIEGDIKDSRKIDQNTTWSLEDCNLRNTGSGMSLDLEEIEVTDKKKGNRTEYGIVGKPTDLQSDSQRFTVGISGRWSLESSKLGRPLLRNMKSGGSSFSQPGSKTMEAKFRWNARQILSKIGKPFDRNFQKAPGYFKFSPDPDNAVVPTGCKMVIGSDRANRLAVVRKRRVKVVQGVAKKAQDKWTLESGQI